MHEWMFASTAEILFASSAWSKNKENREFWVLSLSLVQVILVTSSIRSPLWLENLKVFFWLFWFFNKVTTRLISSEFGGQVKVLIFFKTSNELQNSFWGFGRRSLYFLLHVVLFWTQHVITRYFMNACFHLWNCIAQRLSYKMDRSPWLVLNSTCSYVRFDPLIELIHSTETFVIFMYDYPIVKITNAFKFN